MLKIEGAPRLQQFFNNIPPTAGLPIVPSPVGAFATDTIIFKIFPYLMIAQEPIKNLVQLLTRAQREEDSPSIDFTHIVPVFLDIGELFAKVQGSEMFVKWFGQMKNAFEKMKKISALS